MTTTQPGRMTDQRGPVEQRLAKWLTASLKPNSAELHLYSDRSLFAIAREVDAEAAAQRTTIAELAAALGKWHSTHGWKDDRAMAESFADCTHTLCVSDRALLAKLPKEQTV